MNLKLTIELIPATCWYKNVRKITGKQRWDVIRNICYKKSNHRCVICGVQEKGKMHCHEVWEYDDQNKIQTLKSFKTICWNCHMIKHIGFANIQALKGRLNMEKLIQHFLRVNQVERSVFKQHYDECAKQWIERSKYQWKMNLGKWEKIDSNKKNDVY